MPVLSVQLKGININREDFKGRVAIKNVNNNVSVKDLREDEINVGEPKKTLIFTFEFKSEYMLEKPKKKFGTLVIMGDVIYINEAKELKSIYKQWKKNKKIKESVLVEILQSAFDIAKIEAIYLSNKVLLPSPIELPKVRKQNQNQGYIG